MSDQYDDVENQVNETKEKLIENQSDYDNLEVEYDHFEKDLLVLKESLKNHSTNMSMI